MELVEVNDKDVGLVMSKEEAMLLLSLYVPYIDPYKNAHHLTLALKRHRIVRGRRRELIEKFHNLFVSDFNLSSNLCKNSYLDKNKATEIGISLIENYVKSKEKDKTP